MNNRIIQQSNLQLDEKIKENRILNNKIDELERYGLEIKESIESERTKYKVNFYYFIIM